jgi:hypothetical protein
LLFFFFFILEYIRDRKIIPSLLVLTAFYRRRILLPANPVFCIFSWAIWFSGFREPPWEFLKHGSEGTYATGSGALFLLS